MIILPGFSQAQLYVGPSFALRGSSVSFFEQRNKKEFSSRPSLGFDAGLMVSRRMKERYTFNAQLLYSRKTKLIFNELDPIYRNHQQNNFLELPLTYTIEFKRLVGQAQAGMTKSYTWFMGAGPTVSYWMGGRGTMKSSYLKEQLIEELDYKIVFNEDSTRFATSTNLLNVTNGNKLQFAINFTGGVILEPVAFHKIILSAHLEVGQRFLAKSNEGRFSDNVSDFDPQRAKFHSIRISASYIFDLKLEESHRGKSTIRNRDAANVRKPAKKKKRR